MKRKGLSALLTLGFGIFLFSCSKLNEPTELGDDLIPVVDNVNTFDTTLTLQSGFYPFTDTSKHLIEENMALGKISDPVFGTTSADMFFNLSSTVYGNSPFYHRDSAVVIDSVVLQLAYAGTSYGDTSRSSQVNIEVAEINKNNDFFDSVLYRFDRPGFTTGAVLGNTSFSIPQFRDSVTVIRKDTTKVTNVLRVRLNNSIGQKLSRFDTAGNGGFKNDSLFRDAFRGLAVKTSGASGFGTLAYFSLFNTKTALMVYYKVTKNGVRDTATAIFQHATYSQANSIMRTAGGDYLANLGKTSSDQLYIQSSPMGSYAAISLPGLTNFPNKVIHRAELIAFKIPSASENIFTVPNRLLLDHKGASDTAAFLFDSDLQPNSNGSFNFNLFGGTLRSDNSYRFNLTRYVQGIVTRKEPNDTLRLYAPLRSRLFAKNFGQYFTVPALSNIANGRVVLAGANHPNVSMRLRLRIIYSNL